MEFSQNSKFINYKTVNKAYKIRIYPTENQRILIHKTFGCVRLIYNLFLDLKQSAYNDYKGNFSKNECSKLLTKLKKSKEYSFLKEPDKCSLQNALKDLDNAYTRFFKKVSEFPKFKSKKNPKKSYRTNITNDNIKVLKNKIQLPKLRKIKVRDKNLPKNCKINNATISVENNRYYVSLSCEVKVIEYEKTKKTIGIDLGIKDLMTLSDGTKIYNPHFLVKFLGKIGKLNRKLSRKTIGSCAWRRTKKKLNNVYHRINNLKKDFIQKLTTELVKTYDVICLESLNIAGMIKNRKLSRSIAEVSWYEIKRQLEYKAQWYGKRIVCIDKFIPSSQECSCCGNKNSEIKNLKIREWDCPNCNSHHDRDVNVAKNILKYGLELL